MHLEIDEIKNIAYVKLTGRVNSKDVLDAFDITVSHEKYRKGMGRIWDFREVDLSAIHSEMIVQMAQYSTRFPPGINDVKVAFVTEGVLEYGMSRMFQMSSRAKTPIRVFRSMDEAEKWMME